ncbi:hypothetical protein [Priestia megaterium]|uniref:hypothetical protein n=1 Tax=Priestia megaterium TaxID=1404 RepID=UPI0030131D08
MQRTDSLQRICVLLLVAIVCGLEGNVNVLKALLKSKGLDLGYFVSALNICSIILRAVIPFLSFHSEVPLLLRCVINMAAAETVQKTWSCTSTYHTSLLSNTLLP